VSEIDEILTKYGIAAEPVRPWRTLSQDVLGDAIWAVLLDKLHIYAGSETYEYPDGDGETLIDLKDALVDELSPQLQSHDSDCQAHQHTYVHQGEPGLFTHGNRNGSPIGIDAVGTNGRRLLVRDDADGVYVGGAMFTDDQALQLAAHLKLMVGRRRLR